MTLHFHQFMLDLNFPGHLNYILLTWPFLKPIHLSSDVEGKFRRHSAWDWESCLELLEKEPVKEPP